MPEHPGGIRRRSLLARAALALQAGIGAAVAVPLVGAFAYPLWGRVTRTLTGFVPVGPVGRFPDGRPVRVPVRGDQWDAWKHKAGVRIGAVWVVRRGDQFAVFTTTCPHFGCAVGWAADSGEFVCPCHGSRFRLDGRRIAPATGHNPAPRDMDPLAWRVEAGQLLVRFQRFRAGVPERIVV